MEKDLYFWILEQRELGIRVTKRMVKDKAMAISNVQEFIASKGWLDKFKARYDVEFD